MMDTPMMDIFCKRRDYLRQSPDLFYDKKCFNSKFTGKHLCQSLFFNEVVGLRPPTLLKKRLRNRFFAANFAKFLRTPF